MQVKNIKTLVLDDFDYQNLDKETLNKIAQILRKEKVDPESEIVAGDEVWLKSACHCSESQFKSKDIIMVAPRMTVSKVYIDKTADCVWWDGREYRENKFNLCVLRKI